MGKFALPQPISLTDSGPPPNANYVASNKHYKFRDIDSPEGVIQGNVGDEATDLDTRRHWSKIEGEGTKVGWVADSVSSDDISGPPSGYPTTEAANVVMMSDSLFITGADTEAENTINQLAELLPSNFTVRNAAVSGNTLNQMTARYTADVHPYAGGYAFLLAGYNDIVNGESAEDTFEELEALVDLFVADGFTVCVCTVPLVLKANETVALQLAEYNQRIRSRFANIFDLEMWMTPVQANYDDQLHFNSRGHAWGAYGLDQKFQRAADIRWPISPGRVAPQVWNDIIDGSPGENLASGVIPSVHGSHASGVGTGFLSDGSWHYIFNQRSWLKIDSINGIRPSSNGTLSIGSAGLLFINGWFSGDLHSKTSNLTPITKAARNALTAADGMICYQSDNTPGFRFYENGAWVKNDGTADP